MSTVQLSAADIEELLAELGRRLGARGLTARLRVVGGTVVALSHDAQRRTADIDAAIEPRAAVLAEAEAMAAERGLPPGWLNSRATSFLPAVQEWAPPRVYGGLTVELATPRMVLAMKLASTRDRDARDLPVLLRAS